MKRKPFVSCSIQVLAWQTNDYSNWNIMQLFLNWIPTTNLIVCMNVLLSLPLFWISLLKTWLLLPSIPNQSNTFLNQQQQNPKNMTKRKKGRAMNEKKETVQVEEKNMCIYIYSKFWFLKVVCCSAIYYCHRPKELYCYQHTTTIQLAVITQHKT